jgi:hypothetical protein
MDDHVEGVLAAAGLEVGGDSGVPLLHATSVEGASAIVRTGRLVAAEGDTHVYVATHPSIAADLGRDVLVPVRIAVDDLRVYRRWPVEPDLPVLRWEFAIDGLEVVPLAVGHRAYDDAEATAGPGVADDLGIDPRG